MSDLNEWIKERRRIHDAATGGVWVHDEYTGVEGIVYPDTAFAEAVADCGDRDDSAAIVDAHNMFPRALNALEAVNAQIDRMEADANTYGDGGHDLACDALFAYVMTLRQAIEGAIK